MPHPVDGRGQLAGRGLSRGPQQVRHVDEVGQHLAVIGGRALVVAAVGQHLRGQLPGQPPQRQPEQPLVGEEDGQPGQRLEPLDQVVAADVVLQVAAQESRVSRQPGGEIRLDVAARRQSAVQAAPRPGAQRGGVRVPGIAAAELG